MPVAFRLCLVALVLGVAASGCASYKPKPLAEVPFKERAQTKTDGRVRVTVAVLSAEESKQLFDVNLAGKHIQPVWLEIENRDDVPYWFSPHSLDADYYSPAEVAWKSHRMFGSGANRKMNEHFENMSIDRFISPGETVSGFAFVSQDLGTKEVTVDLLGPGRIRSLVFLVPVPGVKTDYEAVDFDNLYPKDRFKSYDEASLQKALEALPAVCTDKKGKGTGDPLNIVVIGDLEDIFAVFVRAGWDETERIYLGSAWETTWSFIFGTQYRYSPMSSLYVYGRPQDISFQKARLTIHERNHLRLWMTPKTFSGKKVWIGQISRDIGVRFTHRSPTLTTHKIDPDVDETRGYLAYDLLNTRGVAKVGFVGGVGAAPASKPRENLTGDPYYTDGLRVVFLLSHDPVPFAKLEFFNWDFPTGIEMHRGTWLNRN